MSKCHMIALYVGLVLAITAVVFLDSVVGEQQERIAGLEERAVALDGWANSVDERLARQGGLPGSNQQRIAGLEERQVAINDWANGIDELLHRVQRTSTEDSRRVSAVESRIASTQQISTSNRSRVTRVESRISAVENRTVRAPQPSQPAVSPELVEILTVFAEWTEGVDQWQNNYAQWRRSVDSQLRCAVTVTVLKDIFSATQGDFTKWPQLFQQGAVFALGC